MARLTCLGLIMTLIVCVGGESVGPVEITTFTEDPTRLPCEFKELGNASVVQVTWSREKSNKVKELIITKHITEGLKEFSGFTDRVRFENSDDTKDFTLMILSTKESDQATYMCHITTFPSGNFEKHITLTVWRMPISTLEPVILQEGQSYCVAATCRAVGLPPPGLSWDTDVPGKTQNKTSEDGFLTSFFFLHPLRGMNGQKLDCLVWHPALKQPRRHSNMLVVHFPPDAVVAGYDQSWAVNRKGAELRCEGGGNPRPHNITWTRKGRGLPEGVSMEENRLLFTRPLNKTDEGVYQCEARNIVGVVRAEINVEIPETSKASQLESSFGTFPIMIIGAAAAFLLVVMVIIIILVNRHHRRRTRKLKRELSERKDEINNLSRQASMRRLNSVSTDPRIQNEECALIPIDSLVKNSLLSLEDNSTLCGQREVHREGEYDSLGRPAIYTSYRSEKGSGRRRETEADREERIRKVEYFLKNSPLALQQHNRREQSPPPLSVSSGPPREEGVEKEEWGQREGVTEGEEGDCSSHSYQISEALSNHFHYSNGFLRPKPHPNAILLHPQGQVI